MATETTTDVMHRKLVAEYPSLPPVMSTLLRAFEADNPSWSYSQADMRRSFYGASASQTEADAARVYWAGYTPGGGGGGAAFTYTFPFSLA